MDQGYVDIMLLPDGEMQEGRDAGMRMNHAAGRNAMDGDMQQILEDFRVVSVFIYFSLIPSTQALVGSVTMRWTMRMNGGSTGVALPMPQAPGQGEMPIL